MAEKKEPGRTITTKYGTRINVEGLTPEQINKVKNTAQSKGMYGSKGAALAKQFQKNAVNVKPVSAPPPTGGPLQVAPQTGGPLYIDPTTGAFDPNAALGGAPDVFTAGDLEGSVKQAQDANYAFMTKGLADQKMKDLEATKQELRERGVPISGDPNSAYGSAIKSVEDRYGQMDQDARNQSIMLGNQTLSTQAGVQNQARDSFLNGVLGVGQAQQGFYGMTQDQAFRQKQLDWQAKQAQRDRQLQLQIARMRGGGGGGGSGGGGDAGPIIGGAPPGFNIGG